MNLVWFPRQPNHNITNYLPNMYKTVIFLIIVDINNGLDLLLYSDPNSCNQSQYFNTEMLKCENCNVKKYLLPDYNNQQCACNTKGVTNFNLPLKEPRCTICPMNHIYSDKLKRCIRCNNGIIKRNNNLECKPCRPNEILIYNYINGTGLKETHCVECVNGMIPSEDKTYCMPCPILNPIVTNGVTKCYCDFKSVLLDNICISTDIFPELSNDKREFFLQYNIGGKVKSTLFDKYLKLNIYLCKLRNTTACQFLANLCALTLFTNYENSPCGIWLESRYSVTTEIDRTLPWLYYREGDANVILNYKKISAEYSLDTSTKMSMLYFTQIVYNLNGTLKKIDSLDGSDFNLCPGLNYEKNKALRFGVNFKYECNIEASQYFDGLQTEFIVPYLQYNVNNKPFLHAVPILITNIGQNNGDDLNNWRLVRRFFKIDKISSIDNDVPKIIRYLRSVELRIKVQNDNSNGMIYPPLLILDYGEMSYDTYRSNGMIKFRFEINYHLQNDLARSIEISIGVLSAFAAVYSVLQTWVWSRRSGKITIDFVTLFRLCLYSCGNLANAFFTVALGASIHTFIFYKGQNVVYLLLPNTYDENTIKNYIIVAFSLKIVEIVTLMWSQINVDIFLIDWERPKPQDTIPRPNASPRPQEESISVWRSLFIANEWNEIQTKRKINLLLHVILLTFFLQVLGIEFWGTSDPELHLNVPDHLTKNPFSFTCRFAIGTLVYITLYVIQILFAIGLYERYIKNAIQEFVDICSLANISVFILSLERFGYYIHGRSSHGFADTDMATMIKQLKREEDDLCGYRGLLPGTYQQTFKCGIPAKLRIYYNKLMLATINIPHTYPSNDLTPRKLILNETIERIVKTYQNINRFFCAFLEHALKDLDYDVKDKLFVEKLLDIEFTDSYHRGVFYTDNGHSFDDVLFYGNEFTLFSFDLILFSFILMLSDNFTLSILIMLTIAEVLKIIRKFGGKRNLARKTMIDNRFLI